jgi:hypothetical protein
MTTAPIGIAPGGLGGSGKDRLKDFLDSKYPPEEQEVSSMQKSRIWQRKLNRKDRKDLEERISRRFYLRGLSGLRGSSLIVLPDPFEAHLHPLSTGPLVGRPAASRSASSSSLKTR